MSGNPLARRIRLGRALKELREKREFTHARVGRDAGVDPSNVSRLEHPTENVARRTGLLTVRRVLDALGVERDSDRWRELERYAESGAGQGWWSGSKYSRMGDRQRTFAIAEYEAAKIEDYGTFVIPGLLQTVEYAGARGQIGIDRAVVDVESIVAGRMRRQQQVLDSGTNYQVVLEEPAVRRLPAPRQVMIDQLRHLLDLGERPNVSIRVLPVDARFEDPTFASPRSPFSRFSYPDAGDPEIVIVDTLTTDLLIIDADEVKGYAQLYQQLLGAALSDADSAVLIAEAADRLAASV